MPDPANCLASYHEQFAQAEDLDSKFSVLAKNCAELLGTTGIIYAIDPRLPDKDYYFLSNHREGFVENNPSALWADRSVRHCYKSAAPFIWHDIRNWKDLSSDEVQAQEYSIDNNVWIGATLPIHDGIIRGGIGLCSNDGVGVMEFNQLWTERASLVSSLTSLFDCSARFPLMDSQSPLSDRQKTILSYLSNGMPAKAIAYKIAMSENSITRELRLVREKLQAKTNIHAVAIALQSYLIEP